MSTRSRLLAHPTTTFSTPTLQSRWARSCYSSSSTKLTDVRYRPLSRSTSQHSSTATRTNRPSLPGSSVDIFHYLFEPRTDDSQPTSRAARAAPAPGPAPARLRPSLPGLRRPRRSLSRSTRTTSLLSATRAFTTSPAHRHTPTRAVRVSISTRTSPSPLSTSELSTYVLHSLIVAPC
jgi:hypothetical protein